LAVSDLTHIAHVQLVLFLSPRPLPSSTLFPYTTLFRSHQAHGARGSYFRLQERRRASLPDQQPEGQRDRACGAPRRKLIFRGARSEEHTSELQSRFDLVCRLLLEKKNELSTIMEW